jgi:hypothetical protein
MPECIEQETENLRKALKAGPDDVSWANAELRRLWAEGEELSARQDRLAPRPEPMRIDTSLVEECRTAFAAGTPEEKRQFARLFVKRIEVDPGTGDTLMHLYSRPPMLAQEKKPASEETGFRIGLVAGAGYGADLYSGSVPLVTAQWVYTAKAGRAGAMKRAAAA